MTRAERLAAVSIGLGCLVLGLKAAAWWLTHSAALYSDALETTVNVAGSAIAFAALRFAARPADANHPYGHDKAEFFAAVIEGVLIVRRGAGDLPPRLGAFLVPHSAAARCRSGMGLNARATVLNLAGAGAAADRPAAALAGAGRRRRASAGGRGDLGRHCSPA